MVSKIEKIEVKAEFEKLKLKQKILIESLDTQLKEDQTLEIKYLTEKVDFLIKLFNLIRKEELKTEDKVFTFKEDITTKIEDISSSVETLFSNLNTDIYDKLEKKINQKINTKLQSQKLEFEEFINSKIDQKLNIYGTSNQGENPLKLNKNKNLVDIKTQTKREVPEFI